MLKQIYADARAKIVAERDSVVASKVTEVTNTVIVPKLNELEQAKIAAMNEQTASFNASMVALKEQYDASVAALREGYDKTLADLRETSEKAKAAFRDTQISAVRSEVEAKYATEIAKLDDLIANVGDTF